MEFELSPHEVMRGIKVRDGRLVLRPAGLMLALSTLDALVGLAVLGAAILLGGASWLLAPMSVWLAVDGALRVRAAVVAGPDSVTIRNRWRTRSVPISTNLTIGVDERDGMFRAPAYTFMSWWPGREWEQGYVTLEGKRMWCDALTSAPTDTSEYPNPTRMKIATLRRWLDTAQQR